jgi:hypothetical protein
MLPPTWLDLRVRISEKVSAPIHDGFGDRLTIGNVPRVERP